MSPHVAPYLPISQVTFSTGSVATMAHNWVAALRRAGVSEGVVIGALDAKMMEACAEKGLPCVSVKGDQSTTDDLKKCPSGNIRKCPSQYPKMSILKVGVLRTASDGFGWLRMALEASDGFGRLRTASDCCGWLRMAEDGC